MSIDKRLLKHLESNKVKHEIVSHRKVFTAIDAANTLKVKLEEVAKTLVLKADKTYYLVVLAADRQVNFAKLSKSLKVNKVGLPKEAELVKILKIKPGKITGFGTVHKLPTVVDKSFTNVEKAIISGGSLVQSIGMKVKDFINLEKPLVIPFSDKKKIKIQLARKSAKAKPKKLKPTKKKSSRRTGRK